MPLPFRRRPFTQLAALSPAAGGGGGGSATWSTTDKLNINLTNSDLTATGTASTSTVRSINSHSSGKYGFTWSALTTPAKIGIMLGSDILNADPATQAGAYALYVAGSQVYHNSSTTGMPPPNGSAGTTGTWVFDFTNHLAWFYNTVSGQWNNDATFAADPATGVGGFTIASGTYFAVFGGGTSDTATCNFASPSLPSGFSAWG